ncbi:MAG TPA: hypothetical protein VG871_11480 [Vicinamibacterales bacterium]|nr:hypothetical protein [Vicinamibacterales bacterium]
MSASPIARRLVLAAACLACAAIVLAAIPFALGRPQREIRIRWTSMSTEARHAVERQFALTEPQRVDAQTWVYVPRDTTPAMLRSIVENPAVAATDGIDRRALRVAHGPLTERRGGWFPGHPAVARAAKALAYLLVLLALALAASTSLTGAAVRRLRLLAARVREDPALIRGALLRGIPVLPAQTAGVFRLVFMPLVLLIVVRNPIDVGKAALVGAIEPLRGVQVIVVPWLAAHPSMTPLLEWGLLASGALTIVGFLTRASFVVFVVAFTAWASVFTVTTSHHTIAALHLTLIGLLAAPWGDAMSLDALWRTRTGAPAAGSSQRYGFAVWLPGFVFGLAFLAAAWSKVRNGPAWILNGTVRYHFVTDMAHAMVPWGPWLTRNHAIAVLISAAAVLIESTLIVASFTRSSLVRLLLGVAATGMLVGFALFQGLLWWGWWILLLSFLPWDHLFVRRAAQRASTPSAASWLQAVLLALLVVQQAIASGAHLELPPLASAYDMYSTTYNSDYEYELSTNLQYQLLVRDSGGDHELPGCVLDDRTAARLRDPAQSKIEAAVWSLCPSLKPPARVVLRGDRRVYDWDRARFQWRRGVDVIGPIEVARPE